MCDVCCEKFNLSTRKQVSCPYCPFKFCRECCSQFLLNSPDEPSCMNCKKPWGREVLADSFTQVWMNTTYRSKRESILYERERSLMPATQHLVEKEKKIRAFNRENIEYEKEMAKNQLEISKIHGRAASGEEQIMQSSMSRSTITILEFIISAIRLVKRLRSAPLCVPAQVPTAAAFCRPRGSVVYARFGSVPIVTRLRAQSETRRTRATLVTWRRPVCSRRTRSRVLAAPL